MDILSLTAVELAKAIREGKTTAVEATQAVLDKIAASEDTYHCYVTVEREKALQQASRRVGLARDSLLLFNTLGFSRREVAEMQRPQHTGFLLRDPQSGAVLPWQKTFDGKIIFTSPEVPAKGYCAISVEAGEQRQTKIGRAHV